MAKLKQVDAAELQAAADAANDLLQTLYDIANRLEKMYVGEIENPLDFARTFNALTRSSTEMVTMLLTKNAMNEQQREIDRLRSAAKA